MTRKESSDGTVEDCLKRMLKASSVKIAKSRSSEYVYDERGHTSRSRARVFEGGVPEARPWRTCSLASFRLLFPYRDPTLCESVEVERDERKFDKALKIDASDTFDKSFSVFLIHQSKGAICYNQQQLFAGLGACVSKPRGANCITHCSQSRK